MSVRTGQSVTKNFTTRVFATGVGTNADSTPTGTLYVNGVADAASVTVTNITTGLYKASVTLPTLAVGDIVDLRINATVSSVADNGIIWTDTKDLATDSNGKSPATIAAGDIATDAITAASVKADAVTKIQAGLALASALTTAQTSLDAINAKTTNLPSDPADASDITGEIATLTSALGLIAGYVDTEVAAIKAKTDNLPAAPAATGDAMTLTVGERTSIGTTVWASATRTLSSFGTLVADVWAYVTRTLTSGAAPSAADIADAVWDEATSGHATSGTTGAALIAAGSAGDPWSTTVPGAYASGTAGYKFGNLPSSSTIVTELSAGGINITTSAITLGNALNIYTGDDYKAANGQSITFSITSRSDLIGLIPHLVGKSGTVTFDIAAPAIASATQTITFGDLAAATTSTLKAGSEENPHEGEYQVRFLDGSGNKVTQASGVMYVRTGLSA